MAAPTIRNFSTISTNRGSPSTQTLPQLVVGNVVVVFVFAFASTSSGVSDNAGNTYTHFGSAVDSNGNWVNIFWAPVTSAGGATVTITSSSGGCLQLNEIQGCATSSQIDGTFVSGTFSGSSGGTLSSSGLTTTFAEDLILSGAIDQNNATNAFTANSGTMVTAVQPSGGTGADANAVQQHTVTSTGTYTESFTMASSSGQTAVIGVIAIKGVSGGGGGVTENLVGQSISSTEGSIIRVIDYTTTGQAIATNIGTITALVTYGLVGQSANSSLGAPLPSVTYGVVGQAGTFSEGIITTSIGGNVTINLVGQTVASTLGLVAPSISTSMIGQAATLTEGLLSTGTSYGLVGRNISSSIGTITNSIAYIANGQRVNTSIGLITQSGGNQPQGVTFWEQYLGLGFIRLGGRVF